MEIIDNIINLYGLVVKKIEKLPSNFFNEQYLNVIEEELNNLSIDVSFLEHQEINYFLYLFREFIDKIRARKIFLDYSIFQILTEVVEEFSEILLLIKSKEENYIIKLKIRNLINKYEKNINGKQEVVFINNSKIFLKVEEFEWVLEEIRHYKDVEQRKKVYYGWKILNTVEDILKNIKIAKFNKNFGKIKSYYESITMPNNKTGIKEEYYLAYIGDNLEKLYEFIKKERLTGNSDELKIEVGITELAEIVKTTKDISTAEKISNLYLCDFGDIIREFEENIREIALSNAKKIEIEIIGKIKIYKPYKDKLKFAVMHLLRNNVDHGIETSEKRKIQGKNEVGKIEVVLDENEEKFSISIRDDGQGIDIEKIVGKAIEKGYLSEPDRHAISTDEAINYIFYPDFSTADKVSEISGRGFGMDVVKKNIEEIFGSIIVQTEKNRGTMFKIEIPKKEGNNNEYSCKWR